MALILYQGPEYDPFKSSAGIAESKEGSVFVGLSNQGATCYLNGLLQTLFMTLEFRKAIFMWNYDRDKDGIEEFCIPLQLQRLFGLLQLSGERAVDTIALTHAFGWEGSEVFQQQDVQELTRVLFDALEETFKGTVVENIIDDLYAGQLIDYLRCLDVDYQSERKDKFLDFSLAIVPFGSDKPMHSLTECIEMYLRPEILDGDNKYYVEKYDRKVDAIKGLKFGKLPQIMSVQLKRFVYDFSGPNIVQKKLNDVVKFPMILDMNKYVASASSAPQNEEEEGDSSTCHVANNEFEEFLVKQIDLLKEGRHSGSMGGTAGAGVVLDSSIDLEAGLAFTPIYDPSDYDDNFAETKREDMTQASAKVIVLEAEAAVVAADQPEAFETMTRAEVAELVARRGEWIYELYAVLIHSGVINGGHYYAYIKDLDTGRWWNFNDSTVSSIDEKVVREAWGSAQTTSSYYPSMYGARSQSCANAYMLMYRKVSKNGVRARTTFGEPANNASAEDLLSDLPMVTEEMVPQYIRDLVEVEKKKELERRLAEEIERKRLKVKVFFNGRDHVIHTTKTLTYGQFLALVWDKLNVKDVLEAAAPDTSATSEPAGSCAADIDEVVVHPEELVLSTESPAQSALTGPEDPSYFDRFRLRNYNSYSKLKTDAYDHAVVGDRTLESLYVNEYRTYILETRGADEVWEEYFADGISLNIIEYDPENDLLKEGRSLRVRREATVGDVRKQVASWVSYPIEKLKLMKIMSCGMNDTQLDVLFNDDASLRDDLKIYDNFKLYVEEGSDDVNNCRAYDAFVLAKNKVEIRVNRPPGVTFDLPLKVDLRWTVNELRAFVAGELGLQSGDIRLFKLSLHGVELRDGPQALSSNAIYNNLNISVSVGKATPAGYFNVSFVEYIPATNYGEVVELPECAPEFEEVDLAEAGERAEKLALIGQDSDDDDDQPPPLVSVSTAGESVAMYEDYNAELDAAAADQASVGSNEGVADWAETLDTDVDSVPPLLETQPAYAEADYSFETDFPTVSSSDDVTYPAVSAVVPALYVDGPFEEKPVQVAQALDDDLYESIAASASAPLEDLSDVTPSDFGEKLVKNSIFSSQFQSIDGFEGLSVQNLTTLSEVKVQILNKLIETKRLPEDASFNRIRLRDKVGVNPGKILAGTDTFTANNIYLFDRKVFAFQVLEHEECLSEPEHGDVVVQVQRWYRSTWSLGERFEVLLKGCMSIRNIARGLSNLTDIPLESMQALVLPKETEFLLSDISLKSPPQNYGRSWFEPSKEQRQLRVLSHEMRVTDGDVLLLQDASEPLMELTAADRKSIELVRVAHQSSGYSGGLDFWSAATSASSPAGYSRVANKNPFDSTFMSVSAPSSTKMKRNGSSNGVHIKTHRDRLQEQSDRSLSSTAAATTGTDGATSPYSITSDQMTPLPPLEMVGGCQDEADYSNNNMDDKEFDKQGGFALFDDIK